MKRTSTRRWRSLVWRGLLLILVVAGAVMVMRPKPVPVDIAEVTRGPLRTTLDQEGKTRVRDPFVISAPLAGRIRRIDLEPGDRVLRNRTVVATVESQDPEFLDPRLRAEAQARVSAMESSLAQARAERSRLSVVLQQAETDLKRSRQLFEKGAIARASLDQDETRVEAARQSVEAAEAAIKVASFELEGARARLVEPGQEATTGADKRLVDLHAPIDGVVLRRLRESESVVPQGEPLLEIANLAGLEIVADYLSADAVMIKPGMTALIERWGGDTPLKARVRRIEPAGFMKISALGVEEQRVNVLVDFEDPRQAWDRLGDQYRVEVRVITWESEDVLLAPTGALFREGEDWAVFALDGTSHAGLRRVRLGRRNNLHAEILSGVAAGDKLVMYPSDRVSEGVLLEARPTGKR